MEKRITLGEPPWGLGTVPEEVEKLYLRLLQEGFFGPHRLSLPLPLLGLDAQFAIHVFSDCAELLVKRPDWDLDKAIGQAKTWRPKMLEFIDEVNDCPRVIKIFGTARNAVIGRKDENIEFPATIPEVAETIRLLAKHAVPAKFSLVNGGADSGIMGEATDAWLNQMSDGIDDVAVFLVPLRFRDPRYYGSIPAKKRGLVVKSPPQPGITMRATLLHALGINAVSVYTPGGFGTLSELAQELEHDELAALVHTAHSHREEPAPYIAINPKIPGTKRRFFDGLRQYFSDCAKIRTINDDQIPAVLFVNPDDPKRAANEIFEHAMSLAKT
jgi:predicted Rossmann-fold nucleotide-binding protein